METVRYKLCELIELFLLILGVLSLLDESDDLLLDLFWKVKMVHGCVNSINLFLKDDSFLVDVVDKNGQLTEKVSLRYGPQNVGH